MVTLCQECCHNQNKQTKRKKKTVHYEKLCKIQNDNTEENDKLNKLAAMVNTLGKHVPCK